MRWQLAFALAAATNVACGPGVCRAQGAPVNPAPCTVAPQPAPCSPGPAQAAKPAAAEKFPFPGDASDAPAKPGAKPGAPNMAAPDAPGLSANPPKTTSGADFPFPEEGSKPAAGGTPGESSSSSSSSDDNPVPGGPDPAADGKPGLEDKGSQGMPGRHILRRVNPKGTKLQTDEEREAEDLDVAHYYTQTGNLQGAYIRSQDAVKLQPDDPDAHFALAEIARKMDKREEAIAEYNACLKLDPDDKKAAAARKALGRLQALKGG